MTSSFFQIVTKVAASSIFEDLFETGRSLSDDDVLRYTQMAVDAYNKFEQMNMPKRK